MNKNNQETKTLVLIAMYAAIFTVVNMTLSPLGLFHNPTGGSLGFGTIVILLASYHLGPKKGLMVGVICVILKIVTGHIHGEIGGIIGIILDYFLAYSIYGLASLFPNYKYLYPGVIISNLIRYGLSTLSGVLYYGVNLPTSMLINASYMVPTLILGVIFVPLVFERLKKSDILNIHS